MKLFLPSNVYEESWIIIGVIKVFGLYPIRWFRTTCTNYIYVTLLIILYFILHFNIKQYAYTIFRIMLNINETFVIRELRFSLNMYLFPITIISSIRQSSKIRKVLKNIDIVDKNVQFFNTQINHVFCMKNDIVQITTTLFIIIMSNLIDYFGLLDNDKNYAYVLMWIFDRAPDLLNSIIICSFEIFISKIKFRLAQINIMRNTILKGKSLIFVSETSNTNYIFRYKLIKFLRHELCKTASLINEAYGFRFKILTMVYITYVCLHICVIYEYTTNNLYVVDIILTLTWGSLDLIKLVYLIYSYRNFTTKHT